MIRRFSAFGLSARFVIIAASLALAAVGLYSFWTLDIEAYPDPVQPRVEIITQPIGLSAEEVERLTTVPLEIGLSGMRNLESIRSISLLSLSDIKCYFAWDSDYHWDNTETISRLGFINLPQGVTSAISPENPIGEIYRYSAEGPDTTSQGKRRSRIGSRRNSSRPYSRRLRRTAFGRQRNYPVPCFFHCSLLLLAQEGEFQTIFEGGISHDR